MGCFFKTSLAIITIFGIRQKEGGWRNGMVKKLMWLEMEWGLTFQKFLNFWKVVFHATEYFLRPNSPSYANLGCFLVFFIQLTVFWSTYFRHVITDY